jgi:hypothetical protein
MPDSTYQLKISVRGYSFCLLALILTLLSIHVGLYVYNFREEELPSLLLQMFDLDQENNLPTWFSSFLLLNNAFFIHLHSLRKDIEKRWHWRFLAAGFLLMAIDEVAGIHETLNSIIQINWAVPGAILVVLVGVAFVPFLLSLRLRLALLFLCAGCLFFSGALGVEWLSRNMEKETLAYMLAVAVEEGLEFLGPLLMLYAVLGELQNAASRVAIVVER